MFERSRVDNVPDLTAMPVEATFADGSVVRGKLLVPATKGIADLLNGGGAFLEFEPYGGERTYVAKAQIAFRQRDYQGARAHLDAAKPGFSVPKAEPYQVRAVTTLDSALLAQEKVAPAR